MLIRIQTEAGKCGFAAVCHVFLSEKMILTFFFGSLSWLCSCCGNVQLVFEVTSCCEIQPFPERWTNPHFTGVHRCTCVHLIQRARKAVSRSSQVAEVNERDAWNWEEDGKLSGQRSGFLRRQDLMPGGYAVVPNAENNNKNRDFLCLKEQKTGLVYSK